MFDTTCNALDVANGIDNSGTPIHHLNFDAQGRLGSGSPNTFYPGTNISRSTVILVNPISTADNNAVTQLNAQNVADKPLVVQGVAGQTGNLQEWQNTSGAATW